MFAIMGLALGAALLGGRKPSTNQLGIGPIQGHHVLVVEELRIRRRVMNDFVGTTGGDGASLEATMYPRLEVCQLSHSS